MDFIYSVPGAAMVLVGAYTFCIERKKMQGMTYMVTGVLEIIGGLALSSYTEDLRMRKIAWCPNDLPPDLLQRFA